MPNLISKCTGGGIDPAELATAICDALAPKLQAIVDAVETISWDGDMIPTALCTDDAAEQAVFICKLTNVETGVPTFQAHALDPATGALAPYSGPTKDCTPVPTKPMVACFDGCFAGLVCLDPDHNVVSWSYTDADGAHTVGIGDPTVAWSYGSCDLRIEKVTMWLPNADGTYFVCPGPEYMVQMTPGMTVKKWFDITMQEIPDPTAGLTAGTDFVLTCKGTQMVGETPTTMKVVVPLDVNAAGDVTENMLDGSATYTDVCSLKVSPKTGTGCDEPSPVAVTFTDAAGNTHTEYVSADCPQTFQGLNSDVTITGAALVSGTTTAEVPIPADPNCP